LSTANPPEEQRPARAPSVNPGSNLTGIPSGLLISAEFHAFPVPLHIAGVRDGHPALFQRLSLVREQCEAGQVFQAYMEEIFAGGYERTKGRRFRASYLRLLKGWGYDSNSPEGAVMKGWVESRFGIAPNFHRQVIGRVGDAAWIQYMTDKMSGRFDNNAIWLQLDLLFEFAQWSARRFLASGQRHVRLFRGTNDFAEHPILWKAGARQGVIRLNNLVSFSSDRDVASAFGDYILEVEVPLVKLLFFKGLLPCRALQAESEYLVIGGEYAAHMHYY